MGNEKKHSLTCITIVLDKDTKKLFEEKAGTEDKSMSQVIRGFIREYVDDQSNR